MKLSAPSIDHMLRCAQDERAEILAKLYPGPRDVASALEPRANVRILPPSTGANYKSSYIITLFCKLP